MVQFCYHFVILLCLPKLLVCVCVLSIDCLWNFRHLMSSASDQKLFCEVCSAFSCSFDEFVGEKVVSPSYSSTILAPPSPLEL